MNTLRIGINGADLEGRGTGVKRYLSSILQYLDGKHSEYFIYSRAPLPDGMIPDKDYFHIRPSGHSSDKSYTFWEQMILPRMLKQDSIQIFFSAGYSVPLLMQIPSLVVIHDISFSAHPEWYGKREGFRRRLITYLSARKVKKIITVSEFSKKELMNRYKIGDEKIVIAPNASSPLTESPEGGVNPKDLIKKLQLGNPIVLYVGLLLERRYIRQLIEAFAIVKKHYKNATLVLAGRNQLGGVSVSDLAAKTGAMDSVIHLDYIEDNELAGLYSAADVFVYLSCYEGFGIPPLEALNAGTPVVTSGTSALEEIYEESALLVENHTPHEIADKIGLLLSDEKLRSRLLDSGKKLVNKFSWKKTAGIINRQIAELSSKK